MREQILLGVQLDNKSFLNGEINIRTVSKGYYLTCKGILIKIKPLGNDSAFVCFEDSLEMIVTLALFSYSDNVAGLNKDRRNINLLTILGNVTVYNDLS